MKNGRILITGGAGFIGSHLVDALLKLNWEITVLDNCSSGNKICPKEIPNIHFIEGDVRDYNTVNRAAKDCNAIIHFAALVGVDNVIEKKSDTIEIETIGTQNIGKVAKKYGVEKIIYASSSAVYGKGNNGINKEENELQLINAYAIAKRLNELYLHSLTLENGISTNSLRFFNVYGTRQDNRMVVPIFFEKAIQQKPIEVFGDGSQTRDFTHVDDVTKAIIALLDKNSVNGIFNISRGIETPVIELAKLIKEITKSKSEIKLLKFPAKRNPYKVNRRVGCTEKLFEYTNVKPNILLEEGLKNLYSEISKNMRNASH